MLALVAACDALMLGQVEQNEMTAVSLATQVQFVQNMFISGGTAAGAVLGAQYWGKRDRDSIEWIFGMMLRFCGVFSLIFFAACELIPTALAATLFSPQLSCLPLRDVRERGWAPFRGNRQQDEVVLLEQCVYP